MYHEHCAYWWAWCQSISSHSDNNVQGPVSRPSFQVTFSQVTNKISQIIVALCECFMSISMWTLKFWVCDIEKKKNHAIIVLFHNDISPSGEQPEHLNTVY